MNGTVESETDWAAILSAPDDGPDWVDITPEQVAMISLIDCREQLEKSKQLLLRLALAAKSCHLALQAALTAAIAGTANIGAHPEKLRGEYLRFFEARRMSETPPPESDRVMAFSELLAEARNKPLPWTGAPLVVTPDEAVLLERLTTIRHGVEHAKQISHLIEPAYILETLPVASRLALVLLESVSHHFEPAEMDKLREEACAISALCQPLPAEVTD